MIAPINLRSRSWAATGAAALSFAFLWPSGPALADPSTFTPEEISLLPKYCYYTQTFRGSVQSPQIYQAYLQKLGPEFSHLHHYCYAMVSMMRYDRAGTSGQMKRAHAQNAIRDIDYVLDRLTDAHPLYYEIANRKARIFLREGRADVAAKLAGELVQKSPKEVDAYATLADALLQANRRADAQRVLSDAAGKVSDKQRLEQIRHAFKL